MASKLKKQLAKSLSAYLFPNHCKNTHEQIFQNLSVNYKDKSEIFWELTLPSEENHPSDELLTTIEKELLEKNAINSIKFLNENKIQMHVKTHNFIKDVLDSEPSKLNFEPVPKKVLIEFSSPNIAKPFHVGHLRSTLLGNYFSNLKKKLGNNVTRINYLGDWGTQLGIVKLGTQVLKYTAEELKRDPICLLYKAYVEGNKIAQKDDKFYAEAKKIFQCLENGDEETIASWKQFRDWTIDELDFMYSRLGVSFDEYSWESDYRRSEANSILNLLDNKGLLKTDETGKKIALIGNKAMPLIKSDDTTLYLLRDLMALVDRKSRHNFDELYYVVENGQSEHFLQLFALYKELYSPQDIKIEHIKFGRIHGMSTRKGKVVFLKDVLDEAKERAFEKQAASKTTKVSLDNKDIADLVGVSAVIVNDLRHNLRRDYEFRWENILQMKGNTGVSLQYAHCRLCGIRDNCGMVAASECDPEALCEPEAINLIATISKYEESILKSNAALESSLLVAYLFELAKASNLAINALRVMNSGEHLGSQRLLLFEKTREVLADGLKLLGLTPLEKI